ncbi:DUF2971 domain-containing protein [Serratia sp. CY68801]|uniref:DUF2971 domain-containing protein n=1 Tax=Serratia sp. CY68801 TaxID=3383668 RepID=UPI003F9ED761
MLKTVYHFTTLSSAENIVKNENLRVSRINGLNDPFELLSENVGNKKFRLSMKEKKRGVNDSHGIISFSNSWTHPVQWAHYADKHKGVCLVFSVDKSLLTDVCYHPDRLLESINPNPLDALKYKFKAWEYEDEIRLIIGLKDKIITRIDNHFYIPFHNKLKLTGIIFGAYTTEKNEVDLYQKIKSNCDIKISKVRPAFKSFRMTNKNDWSIEKLIK